MDELARPRPNEFEVHKPESSWKAVIDELRQHDENTRKGMTVSTPRVNEIAALQRTAAAKLKKIEDQIRIFDRDRARGYHTSTDLPRLHAYRQSLITARNQLLSAQSLWATDGESRIRTRAPEKRVSPLADGRIYTPASGVPQMRALDAMGWHDLLKTVVKQGRRPPANPHELRRQVIVRERARRKHSSISLQIQEIADRLNAGRGTAEDVTRLNELRHAKESFEKVKHLWKDKLTYKPPATLGPHRSSLAVFKKSDYVAKRERERLQRDWNREYDWEAFRNAYHAGQRTFENRWGEEKDMSKVSEAYHQAFQTTVGGDPNIGDDASYHANAFRTGGVPDRLGRIDEGRFNKGQADVKVATGAARKKVEYDFYHNPDGSLKTPSSRIRESVNRMQRDLTTRLAKEGVPGWASEMVVGSLLSPLHIGAEIQTFGDWRESAKNRAGAFANATIGLLTTAAGGKLVAPILAPVMRPVTEAAQRLGRQAAPAIKEFGQALWTDSVRAVKVAHERLGIASDKAHWIVSEFARALKSVQRVAKGEGNDPSLRPPGKSGRSEQNGYVEASPSRSWEPERWPQVNRDLRQTYKAGKEEIFNLLKREAEKGGAFEDPLAYRMAFGFIKRLPENLLETLQVRIVEISIGRNGENLGFYHWPTETITLGRSMRNYQPQEIARTLAHEVGHHLQLYLTEREIKVLKRQYQREKARDLANTDDRSYESFIEWWAYKIQHYEDRVHFEAIRRGELEPEFITARAKAQEVIQRTQRWINGFFLRGGGRDHATNVYKKLLKDKSRKHGGPKGPGMREFIAHQD